MMEQMTVNSLLSILNTLSRAGHGDMPIFLGANYPLLNSGLTVDCWTNKLMIRNDYYDEKMGEALRKARDGLGEIYRNYIEDCLEASMIEEE